MYLSPRQSACRHHLTWSMCTGQRCQQATLESALWRLQTKQDCCLSAAAPLLTWCDAPSCLLSTPLQASLWCVHQICCRTLPSPSEALLLVWSCLPWTHLHALSWNKGPQIWRKFWKQDLNIFEHNELTFQNPKRRTYTKDSFSYLLIYPSNFQSVSNGLPCSSGLPIEHDSVHILEMWKLIDQDLCDGSILVGDSDSWLAKPHAQLEHEICTPQLIIATIQCMCHF